MPARFYNCHAHCFTYDHVPEHFLTNRIAVSWLLKRRWLKNLIQNTPLTGNFGFVGNLLIVAFTLLFGFDKRKAIRFLNFVKYGDNKSQLEVIRSMQAYYPKSTGLVFLTMDMEYMGAGKPNKKFAAQLEELAMLKESNEWKQKIYPFIFCDPRRIEPQSAREKAVGEEFTKTEFLSRLKDYVAKGSFQGIKLYPALGYFPFDKRMKAVYDFGVQHCVPFMTHCTVGAVHFKYALTEAERHHPFKKIILPHKKPKDFQVYYTHPLNYECLLNQNLLKQFWGEDAPDYSQLKICIGHWGTGDDWHNYLENAWLQTRIIKTESEWPSLELANWYIDNDHQFDNFSWFSIICDLMRKYPNVYADISYTLNDETLLPLLKMILETDEIIRKKVLFGTDFYMVSKAICERKFAINVRAALGNELFEQIAIKNAERYLNNQFSNVSYTEKDRKRRFIVETDLCNTIGIDEAG